MENKEQIYLVRTTESLWNGTRVETNDYTKSELKEMGYDDIEDYCIDMESEYFDDSGDVEFVTIEYSEDNGESWITLCKDIAVF